MHGLISVLLKLNQTIFESSSPTTSDQLISRKSQCRKGQHSSYQKTWLKIFLIAM